MGDVHTTMEVIMHWLQMAYDALVTLQIVWQAYVDHYRFQ
jgi:hypothetical protein